MVKCVLLLLLLLLLCVVRSDDGDVQTNNFTKTSNPVILPEITDFAVPGEFSSASHCLPQLTHITHSLPRLTYINIELRDRQ